jgi:hypothetical protein
MLIIGCDNCQVALAFALYLVIKEDDNIKGFNFLSICRLSDLSVLWSVSASFILTTAIDDVSRLSRKTYCSISSNEQNALFQTN